MRGLVLVFEVGLVTSGSVYWSSPACLLWLVELQHVLDDLAG
jgi:hypothetical protein